MDTKLPSAKTMSRIRLLKYFVSEVRSPSCECQASSNRLRKKGYDRVSMFDCYNTVVAVASSSKTIFLLQSLLISVS